MACLNARLLVHLLPTWKLTPMMSKPSFAACSNSLPAVSSLAPNFRLSWKIDDESSTTMRSNSLECDSKHFNEWIFRLTFLKYIYIEVIVPFELTHFVQHVMYVISCPHATWLKADRYSHLKADGLWCHMCGSTCTYLYPVFMVSSHLHTSLCWTPLCSSHFAIVGVVTNSSSKFHLEFSLNDLT